MINKSNIRALALLNLLNSSRKRYKMIGKPRIYYFSPTTLEFNNFIFFYFSAAIVKGMWRVIALLLYVALHFSASSANAMGCTVKLSRNITTIKATKLCFDEP